MGCLIELSGKLGMFYRVIRLLFLCMWRFAMFWDWVVRDLELVVCRGS